MSQNGTTPTTTDENRPPATIPTPVFVPMMPMFFSYPTTGTTAQQYFTPTIYPNMQPYASNGTHRQGNIGLNYSPYYPSYYAPSNSILSSTGHITNAAALMPPRPLMPTPLVPIQQSSPTITGKETERNKTLNIRECKSPVISEARKGKKPLQIVDPNNNRKLKGHEDSSSTSSLASHTESDSHPVLPTSTSFVQEIDSDNPQDDFLTFIEQKTKIPQASAIMPELNPFAHEFSFANHQTLTNDSPPTTNGSDQQAQPSYQALFNDLIEKSLQSIDALKKPAKKVPTNDVSIQCNLMSDSFNRSTQTTDTPNNNKLLEEYSSRTIHSMDTLLDNFRNVYHKEYHEQYKIMAQTCDELRHLVLFLRHIVSSSNNEATKKIPVDLSNPFRTMIQDLEKDINYLHTGRASVQMTHDAGRGTRRSITSTSKNHSPLPSFSCRQIDPVTISPPKLCLLCQRPLDNSDDVMHKICRTLIARPTQSTDT